MFLGIKISQQIKLNCGKNIDKIIPLSNLLLETIMTFHISNNFIGNERFSSVGNSFLNHNQQ